jgi:hypothetical protein
MNYRRERKLRLADGWLDPGPSSEFDDGVRLLGYRVFVAGEGEGIVREFVKG